jgi:hypothetical protein
MQMQTTEVEEAYENLKWGSPEKVIWLKLRS